MMSLRTLDARSSVFDARQFSTDWISRHSRRRMALLTAAVVVACLALVRLVLALDLGAVFLLAISVCLVAVVIQPRYGLYAIFGVVLVFESGSSDPLMTPGAYLNNSLQNSLNAS